MMDMGIVIIIDNARQPTGSYSVPRWTARRVGDPFSAGHEYRNETNLSARWDLFMWAHVLARQQAQPMLINFCVEQNL